MTLSTDSSDCVSAYKYTNSWTSIQYITWKLEITQSYHFWPIFYVKEQRNVFRMHLINVIFRKWQLQYTKPLANKFRTGNYIIRSHVISESCHFTTSYVFLLIFLYSFSIDRFAWTAVDLIIVLNLKSFAQLIQLLRILLSIWPQWDSRFFLVKRSGFQSEMIWQLTSVCPLIDYFKILINRY